MSLELGLCIATGVLGALALCVLIGRLTRRQERAREGWRDPKAAPPAPELAQLHDQLETLTKPGSPWTACPSLSTVCATANNELSTVNAYISDLGRRSYPPGISTISDLIDEEKRA